MKKKIVSLLLVAAMAATMAIGCGNSGGGSSSAAGSSAAGSSAAGKTIKVGIINNDPSESGYRTANDKDLKATFTKENGYEATFAYGKTNDDQITAAKKMINDGVDYLLLSAADTKGWDATLQEAQKQGTKVILFDRMLEADEKLYEAAIVSDMAKEGETAVNWLKDQKLESYNIIHIQGQMGTDAQIGRSGALDKAAKDNGWKIVKQQTANWKAEEAEQIVASVISAKTDFNVIYAENDDMAKGAQNALDKANIEYGVGKKVVIMGFDCNKFALENLLNKKWNYDGQCNPFQSSYIVDVIKKLENKETISTKKIVMEEKGFDANKITKEDVEKYGI